MQVENGGQGHWLQVQLKGPGQNRNGIGATVKICAPKGDITLENYPVHGYQSSMLIPLHTGLLSSAIDSVVIQWADGSRQVEKGIQANRLNTIVYQAGRKDVIPQAAMQPFFPSLRYRSLLSMWPERRMILKCSR